MLKVQLFISHGGIPVQWQLVCGWRVPGLSFWPQSRRHRLRPRHRWCWPACQKQLCLPLLQAHSLPANISNVPFVWRCALYLSGWCQLARAEA